MIHLQKVLRKLEMKTAMEKLSNINDYEATKFSK